MFTSRRTATAIKVATASALALTAGLFIGHVTLPTEPTATIPAPASTINAPASNNDADISSGTFLQTWQEMLTKGSDEPFPPVGYTPVNPLDVIAGR